jgi:hypothetical protein
MEIQEKIENLKIEKGKLFAIACKEIPGSHKQKRIIVEISKIWEEICSLEKEFRDELAKEI